MTGIEIQGLVARLGPLVRENAGADAQVNDVVVMEDGHAGLTFGFEVQTPDGACVPYVLKLAPVGVPHRGSTDVYRQAALLRALHVAGLPAPRVPWASPDDAALGTPFIIMERLPGRTFVIWEPHASFSPDPDFIRSLWLQSAQALARFHQLDWKTSLQDWETPSTLSTELARWTRLLRHAPDPEWAASGTRLAAELVAAVPPERAVGLVHGDFQPGNVLFDQGRLVGVIDWDLAGIGAQGIDVGWMLMMIDPHAWAAGWKPVAPLTRDELLAAYRNANGTALQDLEWYQAFAHFRMAAIACLNVKLHRNGRRPDALWERFAPSISMMLSRAGQLLSASRPNPLHGAPHD